MKKQHILQNGIKIIVDEMPHMRSSSIGIWVGVGGRHETKEEAGLAHFIEHIVFKGTKERSCQEIKESIEGIGGSLNAFTAKEYTCFYAKVLGKDTEIALEVLSDMVLNPSLKDSDIEQEKDVILEEIKMYMDSPSQQVHDYLDEILWPNHPMGYFLTGPQENVSRFIASDFKDFRAKHYTPNRMVISVAGDVIAEDIFLDVEGNFASLDSLKTVQAEKVLFDPVVFPVHWRQKDTEQAHLALGIHAYSRTHPMCYPLSILNIILGGNMSSRLFQELREEQGLAYDVRSSVYRYEDTGTLEISAGLESENLEKTLLVTMKALKRLKDELVSEDELARAKAYYKGRVQLSLEKTSTRMSWQGEDLLFRDRPFSEQNILEQINAVSAESLQKVAQDIFQDKRICMAVISPKHKPENLNDCLHVL
jgi:predicted Zn-dependent peptidase